MVIASVVAVLETTIGVLELIDAGLTIVEKVEGKACGVTPGLPMGTFTAGSLKASYGHMHEQSHGSPSAPGTTAADAAGATATELVPTVGGETKEVLAAAVTAEEPTTVELAPTVGVGTATELVATAAGVVATELTPKAVAEASTESSPESSSQSPSSAESVGELAAMAVDEVVSTAVREAAESSPESSSQSSISSAEELAAVAADELASVAAGVTTTELATTAADVVPELPPSTPKPMTMVSEPSVTVRIGVGVSGSAPAEIVDTGQLVSVLNSCLWWD